MSNDLRRAIATLVGGKKGDRFFAEILFDMVRIPDLTCTSMGVGIRGTETILVYNPLLLEKWTDAEIVGVLKHEIGHIVCDHIARIAACGNHEIGNVAADLVVNQMVGSVPKKLVFFKGGKFVEGETVTLENMKKQFPDLLPDKHFEWYFDMIMKDAPKAEDFQTADDHSHMQGDGEVSPSTARRIWREKVQAAAERAKRAGDGPQGAMRDVLSEFLDQSVDWRTALRQFPQDAERTDTTRTRKKRNRRYGFLYPGAKIERKCKLAVGFDLSGSISDTIKNTFTKELTEIAAYAELYVLFFDSTVTAEKTFEEADFSWKVPGGGGTCFQPVFDRAEEMGVDGLIMLTDGEGFDKITEPSFPVLWGILEGYAFNQAFGQHMVVK